MAQADGGTYGGGREEAQPTTVSSSVASEQYAYEKPTLDSMLTEAENDPSLQLHAYPLDPEGSQTDIYLVDPQSHQVFGWVRVSDSDEVDQENAPRRVDNG